jgi:hypothetical protein
MPVTAQWDGATWPDSWTTLVTEGRAAVELLRSLDENDEADELEREIAEVERHVARLHLAARRDQLVGREVAEGRVLAPSRSNLLSRP